MTETIVTIVKTLIVLVFLSMFLELLLPKGSTKKYAKFVMGILVLIVMVNPIIRLIGEDLPLMIDFDNAMSFESSTEEIVASGNSLREKITADSMAVYKKEIESNLKSELKKIAEISSVTISVDESNGKYNITVLLDFGNEEKTDGRINEKIRKTAEDFFVDNYDIDNEQIDVSVSCITG